MNIKAIETVYKGYKFRSRLEARWAIFFEELGLGWQYEVEGFDLPSGRYLPDFYLPSQHCHVEIKPPHIRPSLGSYSPRVYMAGRMTEPCWRPFSVYGSHYAFDAVPPPAMRTFEGRSIIYTGPFRTELCNHSFLHGIDSAAYCCEPEVFARSIAGIKACQVFFCWFEDLEAYGSLVEVGIAHSLGKRIAIGFTDNTRPDRWDPRDSGNDLWFAAHCAEEVFSGGKEEVLASFGGWLAKHYPVPREIQLGRELAIGRKENVCLFYGDPVESIENSIWWGRYPLGDFDALSINRAALAARQARFEHGQNGAS